MDATPVGQVGRITRGPDKGKFVLVHDDRRRTGGFLIFQSLVSDVFSAREVFDYWVERYEDLDGFFEETGWNVQWQFH